jgi:O-antigen ligase
MNKISPYIVASTLALCPLAALHGKICITYVPVMTLLLALFSSNIVSSQNIKQALYKFRFLIFGILIFLSFLFVHTHFIANHYVATLRFNKLVTLFPIALFFLIIVNHIKLPQEQISKLLNGIMILCALSAILIIIQYNTQMFYYAWIHNIENPSKIPQAEYNSSSVLIIMMGYISFLLQPKKHIYHFATPIVLTVLAFIGSESQTAQMLAVLIPLTYLFINFAHNRQWIYLAIPSVLLFLMLAKPFLIIWLYESGSFQDLLLSNNFLKSGYAIYRFDIWYLISQKIIEAPFWGYGLNGTETFNNLAEGSPYNDGKTISHPHDYILQTWLDLGLIGILFLILIKVFLFQLISKLGKSHRQCAISSAVLFIAVVFVSSVSYDMWQGFWLSFIFIMTALHMIVLQENKKN